MVVVRSVKDLGGDRSRQATRASCGSRFLTRSTTSIMLAPGWRWILTITAGVLFFHAARRTFSGASITVATSERTTGAPLR